jgi:hypothetical protein
VDDNDHDEDPVLIWPRMKERVRRLDQRRNGQKPPHVRGKIAMRLSMLTLPSALALLLLPGLITLAGE